MQLAQIDAPGVKMDDVRDFMRAVNHGLRQPIRGMRGYLHLLRDHVEGRLDDEAQRYLRLVSGATERLDERIDGLLAISHLASQDPSVLGRCEVPLELVLRDAMADLAHDVKAAGVTIDCDDLPTVHAYRPHMQILFDNLLGNAIKFRAPDRPLHVHITAREEGAMTVVDVRDNGIGIPEAAFERVFEMFGRIRNGVDVPGEGMGLAVARRIARMYGGDITLRPRPDPGATFSVRLPPGPAGRDPV